MPAAALLRLKVQLFALSAVLVLATIGGVLLVSRDWARSALTEELGRNALLLQREVRDTVEYAVSLRIPLRSSEVVHSGFEFLNRMLSENADVRFIAVTDSAGDLLFYEGTNRQRLGSLFADAELAATVTADGLAMGGTVADAIPVGNFAITAVPLGEPEAPFGVLYVGVDRRVAEAYLDPALTDALVLALACLALALYLAWSVADAACGARLSSLHRLFDGGANGALGTIPKQRRDDDVGRLLRLCGRVHERLADAHRRVVSHAEDVRNGAFDAEIAGRVDELRYAVDRDVGAALAKPPPTTLDRRPLALRHAAFAAAMALSLALVPAIAGWIGGQPVVAATAIGMVVGAAAGWLAAAGGGRWVGLGWLALLGLAVAGLAAAAGAAVFGDAAAVAAVVVAGAAAALTSAGKAIRIAEAKHGNLVLAAVTGLVAGGGLGTVLVDRVDGATLLIAVAMTAAVGLAAAVAGAAVRPRQAG